MKTIHSLMHREPAPGATERMAPIEPHRSVRDCCGANSSGKLSALIQISSSVIPHHCLFFLMQKIYISETASNSLSAVRNVYGFCWDCFGRTSPENLTLWLAKLGESRTEWD